MKNKMIKKTLSKWAMLYGNAIHTEIKHAYSYMCVFQTIFSPLHVKIV